MSMEPLPLFSHPSRITSDEVPNLPPKTGTGLPMISTRPKHLDVSNPNRNEEKFAEDDVPTLRQVGFSSFILRCIALNICRVLYGRFLCSIFPYFCLDKTKWSAAESAAEDRHRFADDVYASKTS